MRGKNLPPLRTKFKFFPARTENLALYPQHLLDTTLSHSAVNSAIFGIKWAHNLARMPCSTDSPIIHDVTKEAKRLIRTRLINKN